MPRYLVQWPTRGVQTCYVIAASAKEAKDKAKSGEVSIEDVAHEITWSGKVNWVRRDDPLDANKGE